MTVVFELMNGKIELCFKERNQYDSFRNKIIELLDADGIYYKHMNEIIN